MRFVFATLLLCASLPLASAVAGSEMDCAARIGDCDYYKCRESVQNCGSEGYMIRFGYHYCSEFIESVRPRMTPEGAAWMGTVARCLQEKVERIPVATSCQETADEAIASHPDCYVDTGYCALAETDKILVAETIWKELKDPRIDRVMIDILGRCAVPGF
jgi:hypothetical protein